MLIRWYTFWLVICLLAPGMKCTDIWESLIQLLDNYKDANRSTFTKDVYFGLNLAFSILSGGHQFGQSSGRRPQCLANDKDRDEFYWKTLKYRKLLQSGARTRNVSVYEEIILQSAMDIQGWQRSIKYQHLNRLTSRASFYDYEWVVDTGHPSYADSDRCLAQIGSTKSCAISSACISMMTSPEQSYGYHKTHQVLFLIFIWLKGCSNHFPIDQSFHFIANTKCSDIYNEHSILLERGVPDDYRDLFMEQSLFCGILGFSEFLAEGRIKSIPSWQTDGGCFNDESVHNKTSVSSCINHMTSLGVVFYSNLIGVSCIGGNTNNYSHGD